MQCQHEKRTAAAYDAKYKGGFRPFLKDETPPCISHPRRRLGQERGAADRARHAGLPLPLALVSRRQALERRHGRAPVPRHAGGGQLHGTSSCLLVPVGTLLYGEKGY